MQGHPMVADRLTKLTNLGSSKMKIPTPPPNTALKGEPRHSNGASWGLLLLKARLSWSYTMTIGKT